MITSNDKVCSTMIFANDGVPDSLSWSCHTHSKWEETKDSHSIGVSREEGLVYADSGEVVDITRLSETDHWVNQDIGLSGASGTNSEFSVGAMHGVSGLESYDSLPSEFVEMQSQFGG